MGFRNLVGLALILGLSSAACAAPASPSPTIVPTDVVASASSGSATTPSPSPSGPPFAGQTLRIVNAQPGSFNDAQIGYFLKELKDKYGITVQYNETGSPDTTLRAVVANSADLAVALSPTGLIDLVQQTGSDVKLLASDADASDDVLISKASIATVADLKGKIFGYSSPGAESDLIPHLCLNGVAFDYNTVKKIQIGGTSARMAALLAGQIDASVAHQADATAAIQKSNGALKQLLDCGQSLGHYPQTGMMASGAWLSANPDLAQAAVDAYIDANRWADANKDEYIVMAATWVPDMAADEMSADYDILKNLGFWPVNGGIDEASVQRYVTNAAQVGILSGKIPTTDQWVDASFANDYLSRNGTK